MNQPPQELPPLEGAYVVLAGPGTGKTALLARRAIQFLDSTRTSKQRVLALTFTNKAANEMRSRLNAGGTQFEERTFVGTFHSFGGHVLRSHGHAIGLPRDFVIYDDRDQASLLEQLQADGQISAGVDIESLVRAFSRLKSRGALGHDGAGDPVSSQFKSMHTVYHNAMRAAGALDFGDLVLECVRLFKERPAVRAIYQTAYKHVVVDEFQDTTPSQYELLRQLVDGAAPSVFAVADEDQLVYEWNEARLETINRFVEDFRARTVFYTVSHRCPANIVEAANAVIRRNRLRVTEKPGIGSARPTEYPIRLFAARDESEEAAFVARTIKSILASGRSRESIAVIGRARRVVDGIEAALTAAGVAAARPSVAGIGASEEGEAILRLLRWIQNPRDEQSARRVIKVLNPSLVSVFETASRESREQGNELGSVLVGDDPKVTELRQMVARVSEWRLLAADTQRLLSDIRERLSEITRADDDELKNGLIEVVRELEAIRPSISARVRLSLPEFLLGLPQTVGPVGVGSGGGAVAMLTYHQAKGLEFDVVFLVALEDGVFPDFRSSQDSRRMEEERRLFYVGITRTKSQLYLTYTQQRRTVRGMPRHRDASPFISEIPEHLIEAVK